MTKRRVLIGLDPRVDEAIRLYAAGHGVNFTAALHVLVTRGLKDEGITIKGDGEHADSPTDPGPVGR
jgi:hypothetical protein